MKVKVSWGRTPKIGYYTKLVIAKGLGIFPTKLWHRAIFEAFTGTGGKRLKNCQKHVIFQNPLITRPKIVNA